MQDDGKVMEFSCVFFVGFFVCLFICFGDLFLFFFFLQGVGNSGRRRFFLELTDLFLLNYVSHQEVLLPKKTLYT